MQSNSTNYLIHQESPYLKQHAHNPVNWYPWCEEAFSQAVRQDKPIFLSIGYSTCHWCHVMAHESFEDQEVAALLNKYYISIKVDREERPDIDAVYMDVCQAYQGSGGWPLTILMTPQKTPFYAGTYLPKHSYQNYLGLIELLNEIQELWKNRRNYLENIATNLVTHLNQLNASSSDDNPLSFFDLISLASQGLSEQYDANYGGFGLAPKFPIPHHLIFLLRYARLSNHQKSLEMAETTLRQMYKGGIFDHIGGGFSRYSTDRYWLIPHFEKMLYDNALLSYAYTEAYHYTKTKLYKDVSIRTLNYTISELLHSNGGFTCAQDADSEGVEGKYYLLTPKEIHTILGADAAIFLEWFDITEKGNFEGKNVPNLIHNPNFDKEPQLISSVRDTIRNYRQQRYPLHRDTKILTSWNALMIAALAKAGFVFQEPDYIHYALQVYHFIIQNMSDSNQRLKIRFTLKPASISNNASSSSLMGQLTDYAYLCWALIELYQATFSIEYLFKAGDLAKQMLHYFFDEEKGGFYLYASDSEKLISRPKEVYDGALPSGNAVAGYVLAKLFRCTADSYWKNYQDKQLHFLAAEVCSSPSNFSFSMLSFLSEAYPSSELICVTNSSQPPEELINMLRNHYLPNLTVIVKTPENADSLSNLAPYTTHYPIPEAAPCYYLCQGQKCYSSTTSLEEAVSPLIKLI